MYARLAHGTVRGHSLFPPVGQARHHVQYPAPHPVHGRDQRQRRRPTPLLRERIDVLASGLVLFGVMVLVLVAALIAPHAAPSSSADEPWRSAVAGGLLPYEHPHAIGLPGSHSSGLDLLHGQG